MHRRVRIDDYAWFDIVFDGDEPVSVIESRIVWTPGKENNRVMSERIRRAVELAKKPESE